MSLLSDDRKDELTDKLEEIKQIAWAVDDASVRDVNRHYRRLVESVEEFDDIARETGREFVEEDVDFDESKLDDSRDDPDAFFWKNEVWSHPDFKDDIPDEQKTLLDRLYMLPFSYEIADARGSDEKVDKARFALDAVRNRKDRVHDL